MNEMQQVNSTAKNVLFTLASFLIFALLVEVLLGYCLFQRRTRHDSAIRTTLGLAARKIKIKAEQKGGDNPFTSILNRSVEKLDPDRIQFVNDQSNIFVQYNKKPGYKLHPFIDFTGVMVKEGDVHLDYFGFRNDSDLYFDENRDYSLIVMTGGSEAAGYTHETTIAQNLETILNREGRKKYKVLNLAMDGYSISNEIGAYVHLAYHLKPEFVIAHTGWNDLFIGQCVPYNFKRLGLHYQYEPEYWLPRLYDLEDVRSPDYFRLNLKGSDLIIETTLKNLEKYQNIVSANGGRLIVGIQGHRKEPPDLDFVHKEVYRMYPQLLEAVRRKRFRFIDFTQNGNIDFNASPGDLVHSTEKASKIIAGVYAEKILSEEKSSPK